jgi:hypothetical protein
VTIRNARGGLVRTLVSSSAAPSGTDSVTWDRKENRGRKVKTGTYVVVVDAADAYGHAVTKSSSFKVS